MARYRYIGTTPVAVPDLARFADKPIKPGEEIETEVPINNAFFVPVKSAAKAVNSSPQEAET